MTATIESSCTPLDVIQEINSVVDKTDNINSSLSNALGITEKAASANTADSAVTISTVLTIVNGGTGKTNATDARNALGISSSNLIPTGTIIALASNTDPSGYLLCNGGNVSRTTYSALFSVIGTLYGSGDGSSTFTLPNLNNKFIMGSTSAGTNKAAGIPNVTGGFRGIFRGYSYTEGAFYMSDEGTTDYSGDDYTTGATVNLSASRSTSIYGNSSTVQPPSVTMRYYIKYQVGNVNASIKNNHNSYTTTSY